MPSGIYVRTKKKSLIEREQIGWRNRQHYRDHPERKEKLKRCNKERYEEHPEIKKQISDSVKKCHAEHPEKWHHDEFRNNNPMKDPKNAEKCITSRTKTYEEHPEKLDWLRDDRNPMKNEDNRKKMSKSATERYRDPDERKKTSDAQIERYRDPKERERTSASLIGHPVSEETRTKLSSYFKKYFSEHPLPFGMGRGKQSYSIKSDGTLQRVKSTYESRYAGVLHYLNLYWEYEKRFHIESLNTTYQPDFYIPELDLYAEVKGYPDEDCKTKMIAFHDEYPDVDLIMVYDDKRFGNHISELEHEIRCYALIKEDLKKFGIPLKEQIELWKKEETE